VDDESLPGVNPGVLTLWPWGTRFPLPML
jgi:hypothetical protein